MAKTYQQEIEVRSDEEGVSKDLRFENGLRVVVRKLCDGRLRLMLYGGRWAVERLIVGEDGSTLDLHKTV